MKKVLAHTLIPIKFFYNSFTPLPPLPHVNVTWLWCRHQKLVTTRLHCLGEQRWVEKLIRQELQDFCLLCLMEGCQPLFKGKCTKYFCLWLLISSKKISAYICTYTVCKCQIWFIICHTEERTLWCLQLDLSRKIFITTSTWILHRQNKCCLHSFWNVTFTNVSEIEMQTILSQLFPSRTTDRWIPQIVHIKISFQEASHFWAPSSSFQKFTFNWHQSWNGRIKKNSWSYINW